MFALLTFLFLFQPVARAQTPENACLKLTDEFCQKLYSPVNLGNFEKIRLGQTANDINYAKYFFLKAVEKSFHTFNPDMKKAFLKADLLKKIKVYTSRKNRSQTNVADMYKTEWFSDNIDLIAQTIDLLGIERTEKVIPGYVRETTKDTPNSSEEERRRIIDRAWAEFFQKVWQDEQAWLDVKKKFEMVRAEYVKWAEDDNTVSASLKKFRVEQLKSLQLRIPGSDPQKDYARNFRCGIDEVNGFYEPVRHTLTICAGIFTAADTTQILAHEIGHSISHSRRLIKYLEDSAMSKNFHQIWQDSQKGIHPSCDQFSVFKKEFEKNLRSLAPYPYDDEAFLNGFISRDLKEIPHGTELKKLADRLAKKTMKDEVKFFSIEKLIKKNDVLQSGRVVPNKTYLNPQDLIRWPLYATSTVSAGDYFNHLFAEEYNCLLNEKKLPATEALEKALLETQSLSAVVWQMLLTVGGRYSFFNEPIDEEFAQDIEEDVVDAYGSNIMSRLLSKIDTLEAKRTMYLNSLAFYCDPISFTQIYPEEASILNKFTGALHSIGQDRRKKLLTNQIRPILQCD